MTELTSANNPIRPVIQVQNLTFKYPVSDRPALQDVSFVVNQGEFIGIMGPSGAGKTTLSMILKGLVPYAVTGQLSGKVFIDGIELTRASLRECTRKVGYVFQDPEMQIIGLTVEEDLAFGPENYEWESARIRARIPEVLHVVRMDGYEKRETWSLSGGQKQRIAIASSLILEPEILILDEPTSELDPIGKVEVFDTIHRLKEEKNMTVLMVEHEIEELAEMADRLLLFNEGNLIDQGTPLDLFRKVEMFHQIGGERVPQVAELLSQLHAAGCLPEHKFAIEENSGVETLKQLLEGRI